MQNYRKAVIEFMWAIDKKLKEKGFKKSFMTSDFEGYFKSFSDNEIFKAYTDLFYHYEIIKIKDLTPVENPFCKKYMVDCEKCPWSKINTPCISPLKTIYDDIIDYFKGQLNIDFIEILDQIEADNNLFEVNNTLVKAYSRRKNA
jgi:hypothetical protein